MPKPQSTIADRLQWLGARLVLMMVVGLLPLLVCELALRQLTPPAGIQRLLFHAQLNASRWAFLDQNKERLLVDTDMHMEPSWLGTVFEPEPERPPFDRVAVPFHVSTNHAAFRDGPWQRPGKAGARRIVFFGDSVTFGRGVAEGDRYTNLIQSQLSGGWETFNFGILGCTSRCMAHHVAAALALKPDLVMLQASANDLDQELYRMARAHKVSPLDRQLLQAATESKLLLYLAYLLGGDPYDRQVDAALNSAEQTYAAALDQIFTACRQQNVPVAVIDVPFATGVRYARHVIKRCQREAERCLGVVKVHLSSGNTGLEPFDPTRDGPDWLAGTAKVTGLTHNVLAVALPHARNFFDIVHPNVHGNRAIAAAVGGFLRQQWP
ncbi:MAG: SGNH/GDSL hydrolase family protein [Myxococcales bacterium]|nr:SGNH/GDSL hydrolase family protein [Myxococcales bacterium]